MADNFIKHRFHGRRKGKTLTPYRQALLDRELPKYLIPSSVIAAKAAINDEIDSGLRRSDKCIFDDTIPVWLEIGFGNGEFLSNMCQARPDIHFIGCEPFINGVAALLASLDKPIDNLSLWNDDARLLIDALPDASIDRVYLLNPDPWPKKRHTKRRFIQENSLNDLARILKPNGQFIMSTDVVDLADWMHMHTWNHPALEWTAQSQDDWLSPPEDWPLDKTRYMKKALGGETIYWLQFKRK